MVLIIRTQGVTCTSCPVLAEPQVHDYLARGALPAAAHFIDVPVGKLVRRRGFWLQPSTKQHFGADLFLVSTDPAAMNEDVLEGERGRLHCYFSTTANTFYVGALHADDTHLHPLMDNFFPPLPLEQLTLVGRVISAI
ncbi:putative protein OS=Stutzerimonas stutzeri OX=316 GN=G7024_23625 PE=4 SV=1 [Stutzerimonas stutzeri]